MPLVNVLGKFGSMIVSKLVFTSTPAKYALTVSPNSSSVNIGGIDYPAVNEGTTVTFELVPNKVNKFNSGTVIPYTITGIETADLVNGNLTGQFVVGTDMVRTFTIDEDANDDSTNEIMTMTVVNPAPTNAVGLSASVYIADSSKAPPSYTLYLSGNGSTTGFVYEDIGTTVTFALKTRGVYHGTQIPYTITGIDINDLDTGSASLQGYFTVSSIITAGWLNDKEFPNPLPEDITYVTFNIKKDGIIEGNETMVITLSSHVDPVRGILTATEGKTAQVIIKDEMPEVLSNEVVLFVKGEGPNDSQNNTFLDSSTNNFAITRVGTTTQGSFSPHALNGSAYNPSVHGGSGYFNGSSYLTVPASSNFNFANGTAFTVEFFINPLSLKTGTGYDGFATIISTTKVYPNGWRIEIGPTGIMFYTYSNSAVITTPISLNTWTHIAIVHDGTTTKMYKDGVLSGSAAATWTASTSDLVIGGLMSGPYTYYYNGYISNLRFTKGAVLYTSNFTPPTSVVALTSNGGATPSTAPTSGQVALLCDFTNGGIIDSTAKNDLTTVGNAKVSTSVVKHGTGSMYFDGTGDCLTIPTTVNLNVSTTFTWESWLYRTAANDSVLLDARRGTNEVGYIAIVNNKLRVTLTTPSNLLDSASTIPLHVWTHVAFVSDSSGSRIYLNGTQDVTTVTVANWGGVNRPAYIGDAFHLGNGYYGYMDDFRITKAAVYTSNFTPPLT